jgi:hypothetical protein
VSGREPAIPSWRVAERWRFADLEPMVICGEINQRLNGQAPPRLSS